MFKYLKNKFCKKRIRSERAEQREDGVQKVETIGVVSQNKERNKCLEDISFTVSNGQCYCLLGGNGSGKTTSFRCFSKEIEPEKGSIHVDGINIKDFTQKQPSIGYCPQFDCIFEYLTARENLKFYAKLKGVRENSVDHIVNILLDSLKITSDENILAHYLSGGNKRKLSVGISILSRPMVILMDEPSTGMDLKN